MSAVAGECEVGSRGWWNERQARLLRRRPRTDGLTVERIITTALSIVDEEGLEVLTVRRLADALSTGSASLYRHVASRDELLVLAVDHVLGEIDLPSQDQSARARVEWLSTELRRVLLAHPNLLPALAASPLLGPNAMLGAENGLGNLLAAGYEPDAAVPAYLAMIDYVLGTVYFDTSRAGRGAGEDRVVGDVFDRVPRVDGGRVPPGAFPRPAAEDVFRFGLTTFLDGLERRFPPTPAD